VNYFDELKKQLPEEYQKRLDHELEVITNNDINNFMPYFLTQADIVQTAKKNNIQVGPGRGCLLPHVPVYTKEQRFIPIKDVKIGQTVLTHEGKFQKILNTFEYDYHDEIYEINIFGNSFSNLQVTYDHKILIKDCNGNISWKEAKDVAADDWIFIPWLPDQNQNKVDNLDLKNYIYNNKDYFINNKSIYQHVHSRLSNKFTIKNVIKKTNLRKETIHDFLYEPNKASLKSLYILNTIATNSKLNGLYELREKMLVANHHYEYLNRHLAVNKDFCFLLGVLNARASHLGTTAKSGVVLGKHWPLKENVIPSLIKKVLRHNTTISYTDRRTLKYEYRTKLFADFVEQLCGKFTYLDRGLSPLLEDLSDENLKHFFSGFLFGSHHGNKIDNVFIVFSEKLALHLRYLLWRLKIPHEIQFKKNAHSNSYKFVLYLKDKPEFEKTDKGMWCQITNIRRFKTKTKVYDLEVENDHSFLTANGIVHNSAGGSLVAYLLGITEIDPLQYNIPFSRFLSKSRLKKSVPDIDVDFEVNTNNPELHRDAVNEYIFKKYGDNAAQIATFGMLKLKNSLQDSFRIHISQPTENKIQNLYKQGQDTEAEQLTTWLRNERLNFDNIRKSFGTIPQGVSDLEWLVGYKQEEIQYPGLLEKNENFKNWAKKYPEIIETAKLLLGIPRNIGKHAAGVVIADRPIYQICGVMKIDGKNVISYNKKDVAKLGLIKYDNLGLTCLNFIGDTRRALKQKNIDIDPWNLPEDPNVFKTFLDGKCLTIFQHETVGGASFVKKLNPQCKEDLFVSVALNRPGALDAKIKLPDGSELSAAEVFIKRKSGELPVEYIHSDLEPVLKNTYGVYAFQEQVMASLQLLLGYSEEESDIIRSAISDKQIKTFYEVRERLPKLKERGWSQEQIDDFYQQVVAFSGYAFNRAHAVAYGILAYATAYLKYHYPIEWWASVLSNSKPDEVMEKYWIEVNSFVTEPNINLSKNTYIVQNEKLIPPLNLIKGVGEAALKEISLKSPFKDIKDFLTRIDRRSVNKGVVLSLLKSGAINCLFPDKMLLTEKIKIYFELKASFENKKKTEMDDSYLNLTPYDEFFLAKEVLPISNIILSEAILNTKNINKPFINVVYYTSDSQALNVNSLRGILPLVNGKKLNYIIENIGSYYENFLDVCCYGYVTTVRRFGYFSKAYQIQKTGIEINLDFDNFIHKMVIWPSKNELTPKIDKFLQEKKVFLFKVRVDKQKKSISIVGLEEIFKNNS